MNSDGWVNRPPSATEMPSGLKPEEAVQYSLAGDDRAYGPTAAGDLYWGPGDGLENEGWIRSYRKVAMAPVRPHGVGDVAGTTPGSAARFNAGKPDLSLIPASILSDLADHARTLAPTPAEIYWPVVLSRLGAFQMRDGGREALLDALRVMDNDGLLWADCARVFDYGREKYSAWNWARGQAWSIPIGSALRHIVFGTLRGEALDPESGLSHRGHVACNIVMLLWFLDHYPEGDDRYNPPSRRA